VTDGDALLAAILHDPHEDLPRLAYADWLDEHGGSEDCGRCKGQGYEHVHNDMHYSPDTWQCKRCHGSGRVPNRYAERAEFIRVQIEAEQLNRIVMSGIYTPGPPSNAPDTSKEFSRLCDLRRRERELLELGRGAGWWNVTAVLPGKGWSRTWCLLDEAEGIKGTVRRGFVDEIRLPLAAFTEQLARAVFREHPVTKVVLSDLGPIRLNNGHYRDWWFFNSRDTPPGVWEMLEGDTDGGPFKRFVSSEAALDALSDACVAWGREVAGLTAADARIPTPST
jgi:uncharacterized protein (TIGR02996 family)